jgi:adenylate kinase
LWLNWFLPKGYFTTMGLYIILMGVQGAGKGEQARFIQKTYGIPHVSTGDLFRAMKDRTDRLAQQIQQIMAEGKLISDDITNEVVRDRLQQPDAQNGVIFDGYPRTPDQAAWLDNYLASKGQKIAAVLLMQIDLYEAFRRAFGRVTSATDGTSYNIYSNADEITWEWVEDSTGQHPPRLEAKDKTGELLKRRPDDASAHAIIKRIDTFLATTQPLINYFEQKGLVARVDATRSIEAVSRDIQQIIEKAK